MGGGGSRHGKNQIRLPSGNPEKEAMGPMQLRVEAPPPRGPRMHLKEAERLMPVEGRQKLHQDKSSSRYGVPGGQALRTEEERDEE